MPSTQVLHTQSTRVTESLYGYPAGLAKRPQTAPEHHLFACAPSSHSAARATADGQASASSTACTRATAGESSGVYGLHGCVATSTRPWRVAGEPSGAAPASRLARTSETLSESYKRERRRAAWVCGRAAAARAGRHPRGGGRGLICQARYGAPLGGTEPLNL